MSGCQSILNPPRRPSRLSWAVCLGLSLFVSHTQAVQPDADGIVSAVRRFAVPAGPLEATINEFARQAGVEVRIRAKGLDDVHSRGLNGSFGVAEGLDALLAGTEFEAVARAGGLVIVRTGDATLEEVAVIGTQTGYATQGIRTATKTDTLLRDTPQSITVITRDLIEDTAMQNMADVVRYVPGIGMAQGEGHRDAPIFRGNTSTSDFFLDGMRDDVQYFRDLYNIERVEALKGPNAMIFGRGGSGGVINRVTRQANWNENGELGLQAGSWSNYRANGDWGRPLNESAAFRVTGFYEDSGSYRDDVDLERWAINPTFALRFGDATNVVLGYEHFEDDRVVDRGIPSLNGRPLGGVDESTFFGDPDQSDATTDIDAFNVLLEHDFGNGLTLRNQTRYADYSKFYQNVFPGAVNASSNTVQISAYNNRTERDNLFNQTDLVWLVDSGAFHHTILAGAEIGTQDTDNERLTGFYPPATTGGAERTVINAPLSDPRTRLPLVFRPGPLTATGGDANNHSEVDIAALYLQDQIEFSPQWQAIVGLRYDNFDAKVRDNRRQTEASSDDGLVSPRVGLIYKPSEPLSLYVSYSIAYLPRAGEQLASLTASNATLDPEEFRNYEIGAKWDINPELSATAAIYRLNRGNVALADPNVPGQLILVDAQRSEGLELGLAGQLTDTWQIVGGYAYQDAKLTKTQSATVLAGAKLGQVPDHSFSLWNKLAFSEQWSAGLGLIHRSEVFVATDNTVVLPSFTRADAAVFFALNEQTDLQLNIENLFDKHYFPTANSNNNIIPGSPRAFRLGAQFRF